MLGQTGYLMYPLLLREILEKLPVQMQMNWCMRATEFTNETTLEDFEGRRKSGHQLKTCKEFQKQPQKSRWDLVAASKLCFCCLQKGHRSNNCSDLKPCGFDECDKMHHRLLHRDQQKKKSFS
ncbi:unnamed protein product [Allacma fusca]|uniref:CCHC-type domain-containing protein n=1 Tax=Allacma fusca TaxID=39272 RepID=A0A8J2PJ94_9HEXA|nr:unnamed protein product [Allacma fusca]